MVRDLGERRAVHVDCNSGEDLLHSWLFFRIGIRGRLSIVRKHRCRVRLGSRRDRPRRRCRSRRRRRCRRCNSRRRNTFPPHITLQLLPFSLPLPQLLPFSLFISSFPFFHPHKASNIPQAHLSPRSLRLRNPPPLSSPTSRILAGNMMSLVLILLRRQRPNSPVERRRVVNFILRRPRPNTVTPAKLSIQLARPCIPPCGGICVWILGPLVSR